MTIAIGVLIDEVFRVGGRIWLENDAVGLRLPSDAQWLLNELRQRRDEAEQECRKRWLDPGVSAVKWFGSQNKRRRTTKGGANPMANSIRHELGHPIPRSAIVGRLQAK